MLLADIRGLMQALYYHNCTKNKPLFSKKDNKKEEFLYLEEQQNLTGAVLTKKMPLLTTEEVKRFSLSLRAYGDWTIITTFAYGLELKELYRAWRVNRQIGYRQLVRKLNFAGDSRFP